MHKTHTKHLIACKYFLNTYYKTSKSMDNSEKVNYLLNFNHLHMFIYSLISSQCVKHALNILLDAYLF